MNFLFNWDRELAELYERKNRIDFVFVHRIERNGMDCWLTNEIVYVYSTWKSLWKSSDNENTRKDLEVAIDQLGFLGRSTLDCCSTVRGWIFVLGKIRSIDRKCVELNESEKSPSIQFGNHKIDIEEFCWFLVRRSTFCFVWAKSMKNVLEEIRRPESLGEVDDLRSADVLRWSKNLCSRMNNRHIWKANVDNEIFYVNEASTN